MTARHPGWPEPLPKAEPATQPGLPPRRLVALDASLTSTGVAVYNAGAPDLITATCKPPAHIDGTRRLIHIRDYVRALVTGEVAALPMADVVLLEGYAYGMIRGQSNAHSLGELGGVLRVELLELEIPLVVVPPATLKVYATGKGNAAKTDVFGAAVHRSGREFPNTDEADAWWLAQLACGYWGLPHVEMPTKHHAAFDKIDWPTLNL